MEPSDWLKMQSYDRISFAVLLTTGLGGATVAPGVHASDTTALLSHKLSLGIGAMLKPGQSSPDGKKY